PWPSPVDPSFSRANRLSKTRLRAIWWLFSKSRPTCSKTRFLLLTSRSKMTFESGSSLATRLMRDAPRHTQPARRRARSQRLPEVDRQDLHRLAVLGDRAARHHDPLLRQDFRDLPVGQRLARILRG